jgi:hypothetical protein
LAVAQLEQEVAEYTQQIGTLDAQKTVLTDKIDASLVLIKQAEAVLEG